MVTAFAFCSALSASSAFGAVAPPLRDTPILRVTSPSDGGLMTGSGVSVMLRLGSGATIVSARLNGTDVAKRLGKSALSAKDGLKRGENRLKIHSRTKAGKVDYDEVAFTFAVKQANLASISRPGAGSVAAAPVAATVRTGSGIVSFRATLNGKNVSGDFSAPSKAGVRTAALGAPEGLRYGRNRLLVVAVSSRGTYASAARTFRVANTRPLAHAGSDHRTKAGVGIRLNGRKSAKAPAGVDALRYAWTLVDRPAGSKARISGAKSGRPTITPDVPGRYAARLVVSHTAGPAAAGGAVENATVASAPATVGIITTQAIPQIPVDTVAHQGATPGIQIGSTFYANPGGATAPQTQVLVLDRATLELVSNKGAKDWATLPLALGPPKNETLVIISSPPGARLAPDLATAQGGVPILQSIFASIGGTTGGDADPVNMLLGVRPFSIIGVPQTPQGSAHQSARPAAKLLAAGEMTGYLMQDAYKNYAFTFGSFPLFSTRSATDTATTNTITVNGVPYSGSIPPPCSGCIDPVRGGFHVLVLDRTDLSLVANETFATAGGGIPAPSTPTVSPALAAGVAMAQLLQTATADDRLVFVNSIGVPSVIVIPSGMAPLIQALGGTADVFFRLRATDSYSLVGVAGAPASGQEASTLIPGQSTSAQQGILGRTIDGRYAPQLATVSAANLDMAAIAFQPPQAWPGDSDPALVAANTYIAGKLGLPGGDVRYSYTNLAVDWDSKAVILSNLASPICSTKTQSLPAAQKALFTEAQFCQVANQFITNEFGQVTQTITYFDLLSSALNQSTSGQALDLESISSGIEAALAPPQSSSVVGSFFFDALEGALYVVGALQPEVGAAMAALATVTTVTGDLVNDASGAPTNAIDSTVAALGSDLNTAALNTQSALDSLEQSVLSDYGRLSTVGQKVQTDPNWAWTPSTTTSVVTVLSTSAKQSVYSALMPAAYPAWVINPAPGNTVTSSASFKCALGTLKTLPASAQWAEAINPLLQDRLWVFLSPIKVGGVSAPPYTLPPATITDPMFKSASSGGIGLYPPWFFLRAYGEPVDRWPTYGGSPSTLVQLPTNAFKGDTFFRNCGGPIS
jgi:hypothetical protein